ncbi:MAG: 5'-methylthioadenosine/S-adenosylhomocysteine nucleosidase [Spirochaetaceae bacterium]|jgi:adenosylhomocysteine nucleosidase|nr:5'-methylthioadenosine/S-adenosylhomocysteine nucleosidase [Spirochaetaceae bacterium]
MIGIIGAMEDEVNLLREAIENRETLSQGGFEFTAGTLEGKRVVLLRCGIGKVNAAVGCALLTERYRPALVINTGSAGGIDPSLDFGDAIISEGLIQHDVDVSGFGYPLGQIPGLPEIFTVPEELVALAEEAVAELKAESLLPESFAQVRGLIGSGDVFMYQDARIAALRKQFPLIRAVEMEGAAVAQTCHLFSIPCIIIRAVSDIAGKESPLTFDEFLPVASKHSGAIVRRIVRKFSEEG